MTKDEKQKRERKLRDGNSTQAHFRSWKTSRMSYTLGSAGKNKEMDGIHLASLLLSLEVPEGSEGTKESKKIAASCL